MATIAIYSLKGGVGKTTIAVNLAWCAANLSARRTLLWDLDAQAAATYLLGGKPSAKRPAEGAFARAADLDAMVRKTAFDRIDLIPADPSLRGLDVMFHTLDKKKRLSKLLASIASEYDHVLLDCPPGLGETAEQVMRAADLIVVPAIPSPLSRRALDAVFTHLRSGRGRIPKLLPVHSMVDRRRRIHLEALRQYPEWPAIPMASVVESMASERAPIGAFARGAPAAHAFADLWRLIEARLAEKRPAP